MGMSRQETRWAVMEVEAMAEKAAVVDLRVVNAYSIHRIRSRQGNRASA